MIRTIRFQLLGLACLLVTACATNQPAPVIERAPGSKKEVIKKPAPAQPAVKPGEATAEKDWRPEFYTVKKGDTLHSIGLEYGYDYKEIAQANFIDPPYVIHPGQQLRIRQSAKDSGAGKPDGDTNVVITPLKTEPPASPQAAAPASVVTPAGSQLLKEPKALREPYSVQALATTPANPPKPVDSAAKTAVDAAKPAKPDATKPDAAKPADAGKTETSDNAASDDDENIAWSWPANGKVVASFNDATSAKGIDIAGTQGQAVMAAAPGKVIYSGSDLRGYGKLVIIKHNKTYLSVYAHNSQILVREGQQVTKGQKIAEMGSSDTDSVKLHFEIRRQGKSVDPAKYLATSP